jgi:hypothetical protein
MGAWANYFAGEGQALKPTGRASRATTSPPAASSSPRSSAAAAPGAPGRQRPAPPRAARATVQLSQAGGAYRGWWSH